MDETEAALEQVRRTWDWLMGSVALSATNLGIELGLFEALSQLGPLRPSSLAAVLGLQQRPVETWARVLVRERLLDVVDGDRVGLAPGTKLLVCEPRTLFNLAPSIAFHARFLARDFADLPAYFEDGNVRSPARHGPGLVANVAAQTAAMHAVFVAAILPTLAGVQAALGAGATVLDAGCGTGGLGLLLAETFPGVVYTGIDMDPVAVASGHERLGRSPFGDRVTLIAADLAEGAGEPVHDVALLFQVLHEIAPGAREAVMSSVARALRPGGYLVLFDEFYPPTLADAQDDAARMGVHWEYCEMLWGSRVATREETEALVLGAGFVDVEWMPVLEGSMTVLVARAV